MRTPKKKYAKRVCAICDRRIRYVHYLCQECKERWATEIEANAPWVAALIDEANKEYNYQSRHSDRTIPYEWVEGTI